MKRALFFAIIFLFGIEIYCIDVNLYPDPGSYFWGGFKVGFGGKDKGRYNLNYGLFFQYYEIDQQNRVIESQIGFNWYLNKKDLSFYVEGNYGNVLAVAGLGLEASKTGPWIYGNASVGFIPDHISGKLWYKDGLQWEADFNGLYPYKFIFVGCLLLISATGSIVDKINNSF